MAGSKNDTHYSRGYNLYPTTLSEITIMQYKTDAVQSINVDGTPEGNESANVGSIAYDRTNGNIYKKKTGTGNTGWEELASIFPWSDTSGSFTASANNGYFLTAASTPLLPASPTQGQRVTFVVDTTGSVVITANTGQSIRFASNISSVAGTLTNSARGDSISLVYRSSGATWFADSSPCGSWLTA